MRWSLCSVSALVCAVCRECRGRTDHVKHADCQGMHEGTTQGEKLSQNTYFSQISAEFDVCGLASSRGKQHLEGADFRRQLERTADERAFVPSDLSPQLQP